MIPITQNITLADDESDESFIRSSGPGGQHVNKTATGVQLRFDIQNSPSLPDDVKTRLTTIAASKVSTEGILTIEATNKRSQAANRKEALDRLIELIRQAEKRPKKRRKTKPSGAAKAKRLQNKQHRSDLKRTRSRVQRTED